MTDHFWAWGDHLSVPVISVVGRGNVGKTTFLEKLIRELKRRGYRLAVIKHYEHDFDIDQPGKDSWRLAQAGSDVAVIAAPQKIATVRRLAAELMLDEVIATLPPVDIVLTEGYKQANKPKIEVVRQAVTRELLFVPPELIAAVTDTPLDTSAPQFGLDDTAGVADLLEKKHGLVGRVQGG
jgi:molybdopterin-guanine dinucleotide biosynthesis protein B